MRVMKKKNPQLTKLEIVDMQEIRESMHVDLNDVLNLYAKIVGQRIVDVPIIVDEKSMIILRGNDIYQALDLLLAEKAPILKVDISNVEVTLLKAGLTKEAIIEAALRGRKLPPRSFTVKLDVPRINVPLDRLLKIEKKDREKLKVYGSTLELLYAGWPTPLVRLNSLSNESRSVWAKLEGYNPFSNSVKDRIGFSMIMEARQKSNLREILYEATSTNTGIALASIANLLGIKTKLFIPKTIQKVSDIYLRVLGAEVVRLPVGLTVEAISQVDSQAKKDDALHLNQFENDANFKIHLKHTAREIDEQLKAVDLTPTCIIGGLGTSGHMSAISFYFKTKYGEKVQVVGVQPAANEVILGIRRIETGMKWYHWTCFDKVVDVTQEEAIRGCLKIARKEGLLIGLSAGAVAYAFEKIAKENGVYVLIFPDTGYKYAEQFERYLLGG